MEEVPAPQGGEIAEVLVKVGDKVSQGSAIVRLASEASGKEKEAPKAAAKSEPAEAKAPQRRSQPRQLHRIRGREGRARRLPLGVDFGDVHATSQCAGLARELDIDLTRPRERARRGASPKTM